MANTNDIGPANDIGARLVMLTQLLDEKIAHDTITGSMTSNPAMIQATQEAGTFKIATATTTGLGNYNKQFGYPMGKAALAWKEYHVRYDRARGFMLDDIDIMQSGGLASATYMFGEFLRQWVVPEVDALRIAGVAQRCIEINGDQATAYSQNLTAANILSKIKDGLGVIYKRFHSRTGNTIYIDYAYKTVLDSSTEMSKVRIVSGSGTGSNITTETDSIDGNPVVWVPTEYMETKLALNDGSDPTAGGFSPDTDSLDINFLITAPGTCNGLVSVRNEKYIPATQNILADADFVALRIYHDVIVTDEKCPGLYLSIKQAKPSSPA